MAGFVDYLRMVMGWWSAPHVVPTPDPEPFRICADLVIRSRGQASFVSTRTKGTLTVACCDDSEA